MIPCTSCQANCCKHYDVFIDHEDIKKIYPLKNDFSFVKKIEYSRNFGYVPKFILWENNKKKKWVVCLNNPNRVCQFLEGNICTIYSIRPYICRTYPFYFDRQQVKEMKNLCPIKWKLTDEKKQQIEKEYNELLLNFLTFETICDDWNRMVKKEDNFEKFLTFVKDFEF